MIDSKIYLNKLNDFFNKEFTKHAASIAIFKNTDGSYELFDRFIINSEKDKVKISKKTSHETKIFSSLKYAVTWCIFEQRNKIHETKRIEDLDRMINSVDAEIKLHRHLIEKAKDTDSKLIYYAKLTDEVSKKRLLLQEVTRFIKISQQWQTERFNKKDQF